MNFSGDTKAGEIAAASASASRVLEQAGVDYCCCGHQSTVRNPVHAMMQEHDAAAALVRQIRDASSGYALPSDACASYQALYRDFHEFETDPHRHVHLENNILFPRAVDLEPTVGPV